MPVILTQTCLGFRSSGRSPELRTPGDNDLHQRGRGLTDTSGPALGVAGVVVVVVISRSRIVVHGIVKSLWPVSVNQSRGIPGMPRTGHTWARVYQDLR